MNGEVINERESIMEDREGPGSEIMRSFREVLSLIPSGTSGLIYAVADGWAGVGLLWGAILCHSITLEGGKKRKASTHKFILFHVL